jgi:hypothetical protein
MVCAALLFAQTVALVHAFWHVSEEVRFAQSPSRASDPQHNDTPESAVFCSFDALLGQLLTPAPASHGASAADVPEAFAVAQRNRTFRAADLLTPRSRGPPTSL